MLALAPNGDQCYSQYRERPLHTHFHHLHHNHKRLHLLLRHLREQETRKNPLQLARHLLRLALPHHRLHPGAGVLQTRLGQKARGDHDRHAHLQPMHTFEWLLRQCMYKTWVTVMAMKMTK